MMRNALKTLFNIRDTNGQLINIQEIVENNASSDLETKQDLWTDSLIMKERIIEFSL